MYFKDLEVHHFRNYCSEKITFCKGVNVIIGKNGQGKTNLLEALILLTKGDSFRPGLADVFVKDGDLNSPSLIKARIFSSETQSENVLRMTIHDHRKTFFIDDKKALSTTLRRKFPTVLFSPESLNSIKSGPEARRSLLDDFLSMTQLEAPQIIQSYNRALRQRNKLLRDLKKKVMPSQEGRALLQSLNPLFLKSATALTAARLRALHLLLPYLNTSTSEILGLKNVDISVDYLISSESFKREDQDTVYAAMQNRLQQLAEREIESGISLIGPHKHDINFLFNGNNARYYCSQGQQRTLILGFKVAQIMYHCQALKIQPILLLDDVLSELDAEKRENLVEFLKGINAQIFITTTEISSSSRFVNRDLRQFRVKNGSVEHLESS